MQSQIKYTTVDHSGNIINNKNQTLPGRTVTTLHKFAKRNNATTQQRNNSPLFY